MIKKIQKQRLIHSLLLSITLCSIGLMSQLHPNPVMAKRIVRTHKVIRHHVHKKNYRRNKRNHKRIVRRHHKYNKVRIIKHPVRRIKRAKPRKGYLRYNGKSFNERHFYNTIHARLVYDINKTREQNHLQPLQNSIIAQRIANYRAPKIGYAYNHYNDYRKFLSKTSNKSDGWVHGYYNHTSIVDYLKQHHLNFAWDGENAQAFGSYYNCYSDGKKFLKPNTNAINIADDTNDNLMNHDLAQGNNNGHRINELNPHYKAVGIGVSYNRGTHIGGITEDFLS